MIGEEGILAYRTNANDVTEISGRPLVEPNPPNLSIVVIQGEICQRAEVSGKMWRLALQYITDTAKEIQGITGRTLNGAVKGEFKRDCATKWREVARSQSSKCLKQQPGSIHMPVFDVNRRLMATLRRRKSDDRELDGEGLQVTLADIEC